MHDVLKSIFPERTLVLRVGCCEMEPAKKKAKRGTAPDRFSAPVSATKMKNVCNGYVSKNTQKATSWALHMFEE